MLSMKNEIEKIWDDVLVKLEQEHDVSSAAINAWIKPLHIKDVQSNKIILSLDAKYDERGIQFIKKKMYDFYISLAISDLTGKKYDIEFELEKEGEKFDVVILDPPAFTKSRNSIKNAIKGYREINLRGMKLVKDGGYLCTCSCSHFMDYELFTKTINQAAHNVHKRLRQVEYRTQAPDHPILWAADESYYLKFYSFQVVDEK